MSNRKFLALGLLVVLLSACQTDYSQMGLAGEDASQSEGAIRESELRAYCPPVGLQEETAIFTTYERGGEGDPDRIVYRTSISDTTRSCSYHQEMGSITAAIAGRVVPGPRGRTGTFTLPIRVEVTRAGETLYSKVFQHPVTIVDTAGATQFVFRDNEIAVPGGIDRLVQLTIGFEQPRR